MTQYILLIQGNAKSQASVDEWNQFFAAAQQSGLFRGGSEISKRMVLGDANSVNSSEHIVGYMRFDSDNKQELVDLLMSHPVVVHGGSVELCEMPKS